MRIRPATPLAFPHVRFSGVGTTNGGVQTVDGVGAFPLHPPALAGAGVVHFAVAQVMGSGAIALKKMRVANAAGQAKVHRAGPGTVAAKKLVVAGTAIRIIAAAASVPLYNALGQPTGAYGPSNDSIFPSVAFAQGVVWWPSNLPAGMTMVPLPGGSMDWSTSGVAPGTYPITINILFPVGNRFTLTPSPTVTVT